MSELIVVVIGAVGGGIVAFFSTRWQIRKELEYSWDKELRERRLAAYSGLWRLLEPLAKYSRPIAQLSTAHLQEMSELLRHRYFADGGIFLTDESRKTYFALQDALIDAIAKAASRASILSDPGFETIRETGSALRTSLVADVGSRAEPEVSA